MKTSARTLVTVGIVAATTVGSFSAYTAHADQTESHAARRPFAERLAQLGVTAEQKAQVEGILRKYQPAVEPMIKQVVAERRVLRDTIRAETINEPAIRAQAAKLASLEADLAVERAHVAHDIRAVLTPEQIAKLKEMKVDADARIDGFLARVAKRIAED